MDKNFDHVVQLIDVLNALNGSIRTTCRFVYRLEKDRMYIKGLACDLALLFSLLWADCDGYSFRLTQVDGGCVLECY